MSNAVGIATELLDWIEQETGARVTSHDRRPGGGRHEAWFIDVRHPDGRAEELFLRYDRSDNGDPFTLEREARYFRALHGTAVPVPRVHAVHPYEQAVLVERVSGQAWFSRLENDAERLSVAREFMTVLAALHDVDPHVLDVPGQDPDADLRDLVRYELDRWETLYRSVPVPGDPLIELAFAWLHDNVPDVGGPVVIVQGDTGPGNFLYEDGRVTAVLDWELAHLGDPHDDLAWVSQRAVQEPFTYFPDRLADYARASGRQLDLDRLRYYRVFASLRILVLGHQRTGGIDPLADMGNALIYGTLHRRLCVEALAAVLGVTVGPVDDLMAPPSERDRLFESSLAQLSEIIVPRSSDPFVIGRSKGLARILKYLREADRLAVPLQEALCDDTEHLLGVRPSTEADADACLLGAYRDGRIDAVELLGVLHRHTMRETQVMRPAMGALAGRHYDPLTPDERPLHERDERGT